MNVDQCRSPSRRNPRARLTHLAAAVATITGGGLVPLIASAQCIFGQGPNGDRTFAGPNFKLSGGCLEYEIVKIGDGSGITFEQTGGTLFAAQALRFASGPGDEALYRLWGGVLDARTVRTDSGTSTLDISGGQLSFKQQLEVDTLLIGSGAAGSLDVEAGHTLNIGATRVGVGGIGRLSFTGASAVGNLGALWVGSASGDAQNYSVLQIGAGSVNSTSAVIGRAGGSGRVVQSGGSHTIAGTLTLGTGNGGRGVYQLDQGSLAVGSIARGSGSSVLLVDGGTLALGSGQSVDVETLTLGSRASRSGSLVVDAGTWTVDKATIGQAGSGTFQQTGGHFSAGAIFIADGGGSVATLTQSGGTLDITGNLAIARGNGSTGSLALSGGTLKIGGHLRGGHTGDLLSIDGGQLMFVDGAGWTPGVLHEASVSTLRIGNVGGLGLGVLDVSNSAWTIGATTLGSVGTGLIRQFGGSVTVSGDLTMGSGTQSLGSYTLQGGRLSVAGAVVRGSGRSTLQIDGGEFSFGNSVSVGYLGVGISQPGLLAIGAGQTVTTETLQLDPQSTVQPSAAGVVTVGAGASLLVLDSIDMYCTDWVLSPEPATLSQSGGSISTPVVSAFGTRTRIVQTGGSTTVGKVLALDGGASYRLGGGSLTAGQAFVGHYYDGFFEQTGGSFTLDGPLSIAMSAYTGSLSRGVYTLAGGSLSIAGDVVSGTGHSTLNLDGGVLAFVGENRSLGVSKLVIGSTAGVSVTQNKAGTETWNVGELLIGPLRTGVFNHSAGAVVVRDDLQLGGADLSAAGEYHLGGGTPAIGGALRGASRGHLAIDGGVLSFDDGAGWVAAHGAGALHPVELDHLQIGAQAGRSGSLTISNSAWTVGGAAVDLGSAGNGTIYLEGGSLSATGLVLGALSGGQGSVVLHAGTLDLSGAIQTGSGSGALVIDGGKLRVASGPIGLSELTIGSEPTRVGSMSFETGLLSATDLIVGLRGTGTFAHGGGEVAAGAVSVGAAAGGSGVYTLSGAKLSANTLLLGGAGGKGAFVLEGSGATVTLAGDLLLTDASSSAGNATATLRAGLMSVDGNIVLGKGLGTLTLDGGTLDLRTTASASLSNLVLASTPGSVASQTIRGTQRWTVGTATVGQKGTGEVRQNGGRMDISGNLQLGGEVGSAGTYRLRAGVLDVTGNITRGGGGPGTLAIDGGTLNAGGNIAVDSLRLGTEPSRSGELLLNGGSMTSSEVKVGEAGSGKLELRGGSHSTSRLWIAERASEGASGLLLLAGGTLSVNETLVNRGTVEYSGGTLTLLGSLQNEGSWVQSGRSLALPSALTHRNSAQMQLGSGAQLYLLGDLDNTGSLLLVGAQVAGVGVLRNSGAIFGSGTVAVRVDNSGTIDPLAGTLIFNAMLSNLAGGLISVGTGAQVTAGRGGASQAGTVRLAGGTLDFGTWSFDNNGLITGQGRLRGGTLRNRGTVTLAQGASTFESKLINDLGSRFEVADGSATFSTSPFDLDSVDNLGSFTVRNATVSFDKRLRIAASGYLVGGAGAVFEVETSLDSSSLQATQWDTTQALLVVTGSGQKTLRVTGADRGPSDAGYVENFAWGGLTLRHGVALNVLSAQPGAGALYVGALDLEDGLAQIGQITSPIPVYYDGRLAANAFLLGQTYALTGGGALIAAVPEPATLPTLITGLALLGGWSWRRHAALARA